MLGLLQLLVLFFLWCDERCGIRTVRVFFFFFFLNPQIVPPLPLTWSRSIRICEMSSTVWHYSHRGTPYFDRQTCARITCILNSSHVRTRDCCSLYLTQADAGTKSMQVFYWEVRLCTPTKERILLRDLSTILVLAKLPRGSDQGGGSLSM